MNLIKILQQVENKEIDVLKAEKEILKAIKNELQDRSVIEAGYWIAETHRFNKWCSGWDIPENERSRYLGPWRGGQYEGYDLMRDRALRVLRIKRK